VLDKISWNGYESMGFDASPSTQDKEQDLFAIKTRYPIPLAVYTDQNMVNIFYRQQSR
jgi:hypothetical protein